MSGSLEGKRPIFPDLPDNLFMAIKRSIGYIPPVGEITESEIADFCKTYDQATPSNTSEKVVNKNESTEAYIMGAADHSVIVDFENLVSGASRETGVSIQAARESVSRLVDSGKIVFDSEKGKIGRYGIPERAERSTDDTRKQVETASNLYYALVEDSGTIDAFEAIEHAVFSAGVTEQSAKAAVWNMADRQKLHHDWDGKLSLYQKESQEK